MYLGFAFGFMNRFLSINRAHKQNQNCHITIKLKNSFEKCHIEILPFIFEIHSVYFLINLVQEHVFRDTCHNAKAFIE